MGLNNLVLFLYEVAEMGESEHEQNRRRLQEEEKMSDEKDEKGSVKLQIRAHFILFDQHFQGNFFLFFFCPATTAKDQLAVYLC